MLNVDHLVIPAHDAEASGRFLAKVFGLTYSGLNPRGQSEIKINETFKILYSRSDTIRPMHLAFHADERVVAQARRALEELQVKYGGHPRDPHNMSDDHYYGGKGFYFDDPNGHKLEVFTIREPE